MNEFQNYLTKKLMAEDNSSTSSLVAKAKAGEMVTKWNSKTADNVNHIIFYHKDEKAFYQVSSKGNDIIEVKVINADMLNDYVDWFDKQTFEKLKQVSERG